MNFQALPKKASLSSLFLFLALGLGIYIRCLLLETPITPYALNHKILPNINLSPLEIILSKFHPEMAHWRIIFSNFIYGVFGLTEITYRVFPFLISVATLYTIFKFTKERIGESEAILATLLFSVSYYSFWSIIWPHFPAFYFFASLLTIHLLWKSIEQKVGYRYWVLFAFTNFLNITNVILPFLFLPPIFFVGIWLIWHSNRRNESKTSSLLPYKRFLTYFFLSIALAFVFYQLKGVNILKNIFELLVNGKFIDPILSPIPGQEYFESTSSRLEKLGLLAKGVFITFNFYAGDMGVHGGKIAYGWFLFLFFLGQFKLYKNHRVLFIVFSLIFFPQIFLLALGMNLAEERFLGFILPFYLITIASGFYFLSSKILGFLSSQTTKNAMVYFSAFFIFTYVVHTKPIWNQNFLDNIFNTKGIAKITDFLEQNLNANDVILNVTQITELRGEIGNALNLHSYEFYLKKFFRKHRLSLLPGKKGKVGIWLILQKPIDLKSNYQPFYFPPKLELKLIKNVKGHFLYFGQITMPDLSNPKNASFINSPFWSFMTALYFQIQGNIPAADRFYKKMIQFGYNEERAYFNLGKTYDKTNLKQSLKFFLKALQKLEEPTIIPEGTKIFNFIPNKATSAGMIANLEEMKDIQPIKYFWQKVDGIKRKVWLKESLFPYSKDLTSFFYFAPAIISYTLFDKSGDENYYKLAKSLFTRGLEFHPNSSHLAFIQKLLNEKLRNVSLKKQFGVIFPMGLMGIHEHFPPIKK